MKLQKIKENNKKLTENANIIKNSTKTTMTQVTTPIQDTLKIMNNNFKLMQDNQRKAMNVLVLLERLSHCPLFPVIAKKTVTSKEDPIAAPSISSPPPLLKSTKKPKPKMTKKELRLLQLLRNGILTSHINQQRQDQLIHLNRQQHHHNPSWKQLRCERLKDRNRLDILHPPQPQ